MLWCRGRRGRRCRSLRRRRGSFAGRCVHGQHYCTDFDLVALLDLDLFDDTRHRRGHFDRGFVRLEFQDRLIAGDGVADVDEHAGHVAAGDVLSQLGDFEFGHAVTVCGLRSPVFGRSGSRVDGRPGTGDGGLRNCWVRFLGIDSQILDCLVDYRGFDLPIARQIDERREHDVLRIDLEEVAQRRATLAAAKAIRAE